MNEILEKTCWDRYLVKAFDFCLWNLKKMAEEAPDVLTEEMFEQCVPPGSVIRETMPVTAINNSNEALKEIIELMRKVKDKFGVYRLGRDVSRHYNNRMRKEREQKIAQAVAKNQINGQIRSLRQQQRLVQAGLPHEEVMNMTLARPTIEQPENKVHTEQASHRHSLVEPREIKNPFNSLTERKDIVPQQPQPANPFIQQQSQFQQQMNMAPPEQSQFQQQMNMAPPEQSQQQPVNNQLMGVSQVDDLTDEVNKMIID